MCIRDRDGTEIEEIVRINLTYASLSSLRNYTKGFSVGVLGIIVSFEESERTMKNEYTKKVIILTLTDALVQIDVTFGKHLDSVRAIPSPDLSTTVIALENATVNVYKNSVLPGGTGKNTIMKCTLGKLRIQNNSFTCRIIGNSMSRTVHSTCKVPFIGNVKMCSTSRMFDISGLGKFPSRYSYTTVITLENTTVNVYKNSLSLNVGKSSMFKINPENEVASSFENI